MEIFINKYLQIKFDEEYKICIANWSRNTENATVNDYKEWNITLVNIIRETKPISLLANTTNYNFLISSDLHKWSVSNLFEPLAEAGLTKIAMISSEKKYIQLSLELFVEEYQEGKIEIRYFNEVEFAKKWLM